MLGFGTVLAVIQGWLVLGININSWMGEESQAQEEGRFLLRCCEENGRIASIDCNYRQTGRIYGGMSCVLPSFNPDRLHFTPAFILPLDTRYYQLNQTFERLQFQEKQERSLEPPSRPHPHPLAPSPTPPHSHYCQVCQETFDSYFQHISEKSHCELVLSNSITKSIQQLCDRMEGRTRRGKRKAVRKAKQPIDKATVLRRSPRLLQFESQKNQNFSTCVGEASRIHQ